MPRSATKLASVVSALLVAGGVGAMLVNTTDANAAGTVTYECSAPGFGAQKVSLNGSFSAPRQLRAHLSSTLQANVTGTSLSAPEAVLSWSVTSNVVVTGQGAPQEVRATGSGGAIRANSPFKGAASAVWTPSAAGTYSLKAGNLTFTAALVSLGTVTVSCSPQGTVATTTLAVSA